jgi:hypothetical protein
MLKATSLCRCERAKSRRPAPRTVFWQGLTAAAVLLALSANLSWGQSLPKKTTWKLVNGEVIEGIAVELSYGPLTGSLKDGVWVINGREVPNLEADLFVRQSLLLCGVLAPPSRKDIKKEIENAGNEFGFHSFNVHLKTKAEEGAREESVVIPVALLSRNDQKSFDQSLKVAHLHEAAKLRAAMQQAEMARNATPIAPARDLKDIHPDAQWYVLRCTTCGKEVAKNWCLKNEDPYGHIVQNCKQCGTTKGVVCIPVDN